MSMYRVSTHSRPKAAGFFPFGILERLAGFNSQPPEGGWLGHRKMDVDGWKFQLTAARRRLVPPLKPLARKACIALFC